MRYYKRHTTNLISMLGSILALFGFLIAAPGVYENVLSSYAAVLGTFFVAMPLVNALLQNLAANRAYDPQKHFFTLNFNESVIYEAVICLSAIVLLFFIPNTDLRALGVPTAAMAVAASLALAVVTTLMSQRFTRVDFMSDVILVRGLNFFKSAGLSQKTTTGLGIYEYGEFEGFRLNGEKLVLYLTDGRGQVAVKLPQDKAIQVTQYLTAKGITRKNTR